MTDIPKGTEKIDDKDKAAAEQFAMVALNAAVQFVNDNDIDASVMLAAIGSTFWTYLMMISPTEMASSNIDNAIKYMSSSAEEARSRIYELDWAERMTHHEMGNA